MQRIHRGFFHALYSLGLKFPRIKSYIILYIKCLWQYPKFSKHSVLSHFRHSMDCDSMDCNPPGSSVHGISQAKKLDWVTMLSSRGSSWPRDWTHVSCGSWTAGAFFTAEPPGSLSTQKMLVIIFGRITKLAFSVFNWYNFLHTWYFIYLWLCWVFITVRAFS